MSNVLMFALPTAAFHGAYHMPSPAVTTGHTRYPLRFSSDMILTSEARRAFRAAALQHHPDRGGDINKASLC